MPHVLDEERGQVPARQTEKTRNNIKYNHRFGKVSDSNYSRSVKHDVSCFTECHVLCLIIIFPAGSLSFQIAISFQILSLTSIREIS